MPWPEAVRPVRMQRVAIIAPQETLRETLVRVAEAGNVEIDRIDDPAHAAQGPAAHRLQRLRTEPAGAVLCAAPPDLDTLEQAGRADLLAGEAQLEERIGSAVRRGTVAALGGWCPAAEVRPTAALLADVGGVLVPMRAPGGTDPPTLLRDTGVVRGSFSSLVRTYGTVPYGCSPPV
ncbi:hypothetical protein ACWC0A_23125 [Streptomyces scopuliridis]